MKYKNNTHFYTQIETMYKKLGQVETSHIP